MQFFDQSDVAKALPYLELTDALQAAFAGSFEAPVRTHHTVPVPGKADATLLAMPAWRSGAALGIKIASVFPDNAQRGLPSVNATFLLLDASSGVPLAVIDGAELTLRRTAAASALASRFLSRPDANTLLMTGTGKLAPHLVQAHAAVRPISNVIIWGRRSEAARAIAGLPELQAFRPVVAKSLESAVKSADIVSCATLTKDALVHGDWLQPGQHLDLVGAYTPDMREADDRAMSRCSVFVDTIDGAITEAGDIMQAINSGAITKNDIRSDLAGLAAGKHGGRDNDDEITLFKSVGCAVEDLVAAELVARGSAG